MELSVNTKQKTYFQKAITLSKKSVHIIMIVSKILLLVGVIGGAAYAVANILVPSLSIVKVNGVSQKDISWIIISTSFIVVPCLILSVCLKVLGNNLASSNISARIDESLIIVDDSIRYSFRIKHQSTSSERRVITIKLVDIKEILFDEETHAIEFAGKFSSEYFDDYRKKESVDVSTVTKFIIHDYFSPSLRETLRTYGVRVNN